MNNEITCKNCGSTNILKYGKYKGTQLYWCKDCQRKFKGDDCLFHMKVPPEYISSALSMYYMGMSFNDIRNHLNQEQGYYPSKSVVYQWVDKYTDMAIDHFRDYKPQVGDTWIADETMLDLDGNHKIWFWDIIDTDTRFLLASRVSVSRTTQDAEALMNKASKVAGKTPKVVVTDKLKAYLDGIELAYGADTEHIQSKGFTVSENTNLIERWHGILKDRTKVMRAFRDIDTLIQFTDGFVVYYNYFKPHEYLDGKTPAEQAKVKYEVKNWKQLSQLPQPKEQAPRQKIDLTGKKLYKRKRGRRVKKEQDIKPSLGTGRL
jgi:transposase-like protein